MSKTVTVWLKSLAYPSEEEGGNFLFQMISSCLRYTQRKGGEAIGTLWLTSTLAGAVQCGPAAQVREQVHRAHPALHLLSLRAGDYRETRTRTGPHQPNHSAPQVNQRPLQKLKIQAKCMVVLERALSILLCVCFSWGWGKGVLGWCVTVNVWVRCKFPFCTLYSNTVESFTGVSLSIHAKLPLKNWKCRGDFLNMPLRFSLVQLIQRNSRCKRHQF